MTKWVYAFGDGKAEGASAMRDLLGGKGANLAEMSNLGLPVPPGFTITTEVCNAFYENGPSLPPRSLKAQVAAGLKQHGRRSPATAFGDPADPLARVCSLWCTRVDAGHDGHGAQSRPQRRDREGAGRVFRATSASPTIRIAVSSRCIRTSCSTSTITSSRRFWKAHKDSQELTCSTRTSPPPIGARSSSATKAAVEHGSGKPFPQDPHAQLWGAIGAVFGSWMNTRAITYRESQRHPGELGHGRQRAGDGVRQHGRNARPPASPSRAIPSTGEHELYGEFLINAQGEDVVAGIRTPQNITEKPRGSPPIPTSRRWRAVLPEVLRRIRARDRSCSKSTIATCRTWSSPSSAANSGCCRRAAASARGKRVAAHRRRDGERGPAVARGRGGAHRPGGARPVAASHPRSRRPSAR